MSDWTDGYVAEIGYTFGYYPELNPQRVKLAFVDAGLAFPEFGTACELGFGQGVSANVHAAASMTSWFGTDFNPSQAGYAQELAAASGASAVLLDEGFEEFCVREDLPQFDYIGLHGIWSWISDSNRAIIVDFIRRKLKVGGVLYVSYNTQPGWAAMAPLRDLMADHSAIMGSKGTGIVQRVDATIDFIERMFATDPNYVKANPSVQKRLESIKGQPRNYLAHEYFNKSWTPMTFGRATEWLAPAKLNFACSAHFPDHVDMLNLTAAQQTFLDEIKDPIFRQSVFDFLTNQQFRRDFWVRGARKLSVAEQVLALRDIRVMLSVPRDQVSLKATGAAGSADLSADIYNPLLDMLADYQPRTLGQIEAEFSSRNITLGQVKQIALMLCANSSMMLVQEAAVVSKAKARTDKLNEHILRKTALGGEVRVLASPMTGGGIVVNASHQLFLLAVKEGKREYDQIAMRVWQQLSALGQRVIRDGKQLDTPEENIEELSRQATEFLEKHLPVLRALKVI